MTFNQTSSIRFSVEESLWFKKGQEVSDLLAMSLDPEISVQEHEDYITIRGALVLTGDYYPYDEEQVVEEEIYSLRETAALRTVDEVIENDAGIHSMRHHFPVDITIPTKRIRSLEDVYILIEAFDYEIPERGRLELKADLAIGGIINEKENAILAAPASEAIQDEFNSDDEPVSSFEQTVTEIEAERETVLNEEEIEDDKFPSFFTEVRKETMEATNEEFEEENEGYEEENDEFVKVTDDVEEGKFEFEQGKIERESESINEIETEVETEKINIKQDLEAKTDETVQEEIIETKSEATDELDIEQELEKRIASKLQLDQEFKQETEQEHELEIELKQEVEQVLETENERECEPGLEPELGSEVEQISIREIEQEKPSLQLESEIELASEQITVRETNQEKPSFHLEADIESEIEQITVRETEQEKSSLQLEPEIELESEQISVREIKQEKQLLHLESVTEPEVEQISVKEIEREVKPESELEIEKETQVPIKQVSPQFEMKGRTEEKDQGWSPKNLYPISQPTNIKTSSKENSFESQKQPETTQRSLRTENALYLTNMLSGNGEDDFSKLRLRIVQSGETISSIAKNYDVSPNQIIRLNRLNDDVLKEGQILYIPEYAGVE